MNDRNGLNREPWFVVNTILESVVFVVNPVFDGWRASRWETVRWPKVQVTKRAFDEGRPSRRAGDVKLLHHGAGRFGMSGRENEIIQKISRLRHARNTEGASLTVGIGDDAALWRPRPGRETILTCDWFLEGTHFLRDKHPADAVGWKCLARAVSDLAAMGGETRCFLLSLALPEELTGKWLDGFLRGLRRAARELNCELAGGDTTRRKEVLINITVIGEVVRGGAVLRSGARVGDGIYVSGTLGEADLGLRMLQQQARGIALAANVALRKHLYPRPRLELGRWLAEKRLASAMMDVSDGLSTDLARMCAASGVGAKINGDSLPVSRFAASREDARKLALHGGDDYELLFTAHPKNEGKLSGTHRGLRLTRIGEITREKKILVREGTRSVELRPGGWDPFAKGRK
jgi:thiamine-monophosphate kinase